MGNSYNSSPDPSGTLFDPDLLEQFFTDEGNLTLLQIWQGFILVFFQFIGVIIKGGIFTYNSILS